MPMSRVLIEALVTEAEPHMFDQMLGTAEADFYGHQTKHGSFVFGGSSGYEAVNKDNGTPICSSITAPCICRGIMKYFPDLADAKIVRTWAGWADQMKDGVPVLGNVSEVPGLVLATGFCGHGFGIAPESRRLPACKKYNHPFSYYSLTLREICRNTFVYMYFEYVYTLYDNLKKVQLQPHRKNLLN